MRIRLRIKNIVLVGLFAVQEFDKYFFIKNQIVTEEEIPTLTLVNINVGVQLTTSNFQIVIQPNQIIVTDLKIEQELNNSIDKVVAILIRSANVFNIVAAGFNFHYHTMENSEPMETLSKELFYNEKIKLLSIFFSSEDSRYGIYASKNFKNARLKLDVKPSTVQEMGMANPVDVIAFVFNFHFDISDKTAIIEYLSEYDAYSNESEKIVSIYK